MGEGVRALAGLWEEVDHAGNSVILEAGKNVGYVRLSRLEIQNQKMKGGVYEDSDFIRSRSFRAFVVSVEMFAQGSASFPADASLWPPDRRGFRP